MSHLSDLARATALRRPCLPHTQSRRSSCSLAQPVCHAWQFLDLTYVYVRVVCGCRNITVSHQAAEWRRHMSIKIVLNMKHPMIRRLANLLCRARRNQRKPGEIHSADLRASTIHATHKDPCTRSPTSLKSSFLFRRCAGAVWMIFILDALLSAR
jgi:hypothetical protein